MSSSTSRLQLTKLADGENFSNTVLNANWDKVDNGYGTLNSQITDHLKSHTVTLGSYGQTTANAWECTGLSIVVPSGHVYLCNVQQGFNTGKPLGIGMHDANTLGASGIPLKSAYDPDGLMTGLFMVTNGTWYIYTKRATAASGTSVNNYYIRYFDLIE